MPLTENEKPGRTQKEKSPVLNLSRNSWTGVPSPAIPEYSMFSKSASSTAPTLPASLPSLLRDRICSVAVSPDGSLLRCTAIGWEEARFKTLLVCSIKIAAVIKIKLQVLLPAAIVHNRSNVPRQPARSRESKLYRPSSRGDNFSFKPACVGLLISRALSRM